MNCSSCRGKRLQVILGLASIFAALLNLLSCSVVNIQETHFDGIMKQNSNDHGRTAFHGTKTELQKANPSAAVSRNKIAEMSAPIISGSGSSSLQQRCPPARTPRREGFASFVPNGTCKFYSEFKLGGSGFVIKNMLASHACAHYWGFPYGGECVKEASSHLRLTVSNLIEEMGWQDELLVACPEDSTGWTMNMRLPQLGHKCQTSEWKEMMQSYVYKVSPKKEKNNYTIAVHIRRGDVTPCKREVQFRYVPNQYYLDLLDSYHRPGAVVKIFSEEYTFEPFDVFRDRGYELILSGPLEAAWRAFVEADLFITSESSFSYVPGTMSSHRVVYAMDRPWQYLTPLTKHWETASTALQAQLASLRAEISKNSTELQKKCSAYKYPGH